MGLLNKKDAALITDPLFDNNLITRQVLSILLFFLSISLIGQNKKVYYKDVVETCINRINIEIDQAWKEKNNKKAKELFNTLNEKCIKNKYLSNYNFKTINKKIIKTDEIKKPIVLITSATWCAPCWGEIPTLNKLSEKYKDKIEFIVLFWNKKNELKKMRSEYNSTIHLIPSDSKQSNKSITLNNGFKHLLGNPAIYLIDENKKILDLTRGAAFPTKNMKWDEVNKINEEKLTEFLKPILK